MNSLVTGGAGFIGHHLVKRLLDDGHVVLVIDNLENGREKNLPVHPNLYFYKQSIMDKIELPFKIDWLFHIAGLPSVQDSILDPETSNSINADGTLKMLLLAKEKGIKRFIMSSSSSVYGNNKTPFKEDMKLKPLSPYALQKLISEEYCKLFHRIYGLHTASLRYFNVYGPGMNDWGRYSQLIPKLIRHIKEGGLPIINGDGEQRRDYIYVSDVVDANILAAQKGVSGEVYNVGGGRDISINEVVKTLLSLLKRDIVPVHGPQVIEPRSGLSDITKIKKLGWEPKVEFEEGLRKICCQ